MAFTDTLFLFYFLPLVLVIQIGALHLEDSGKRFGKLAQAALLFSSLLFVGFEAPWRLIPLAVVFLLTGASLRLLDLTKSARVRGAVVGFAAFFYVGLLLTLRRSVFVDHDYAGLPPGFLFLLFTAMGLVIDRYKSRRKAPSPLSWACFLTMFPRLGFGALGGPIVRFREISREWRDYRGPRYRRGIFTLAAGLTIKLVLADEFAVFTHYAFGQGPELDFISAWIGAVSFGMQFYFSLLGYSLMAVGLGRLFGITLPMDVDRPYHSRSLRVFLKRWHVTLGAWARRYLLKPLTARLGGPAAAAVTLTVVCVLYQTNERLLLLALWWSAWLGVEKALSLPKRLTARQAKSVTFAVVMLGLAVFHAHSVQEAWWVVRAMLNPFAAFGRFNPEAFFVHRLASWCCLAGLVYCFFVEKQKLRLTPRWVLRRAPALAILVLVVYQGENLAHRAFFAPLDGWAASTVTWHTAGRTLASTTIPGREDNDPEHLDFASRELFETSRLVSFFTGNIPEDELVGPADPYQRLYSRDEIYYQYPAAIDDIQSGFGRAAPDWVRLLTARGVHVIILPVPTKVSIERAFLPRILPPDKIWRSGRAPASLRHGKEDSRAVYRAFVDAAPQSVVDLYARYAEHERSHPADHLYVPGGTLWSSLGIALAAQGVIEKLKDQGVTVEEPAIYYENRFVPEYSFDLLQRLALPRNLLENGTPDFRWFEPVYEVSRVTKMRSDARIVIAGSRFSRRLRETFGLGPLLQEATGRLYVDSSLELAGAVEPLHELTRQGIELLPGDVLIWEFPVSSPPRPGEPLPFPATGGGGRALRGALDR